MMLFENQGLSTETGGTDTGGQTGQAAADDNELVISHDKNAGKEKNAALLFLFFLFLNSPPLYA
jgi:hypothetical protein